MKAKLRFIILLSILFVANSCSTESLESTNSLEPENSPDVEQELLGIVNAHRASLGYATLSFSPVAYGYANAHTDYMISKGSISHDNFTARASGIAAEVNALEVAENVAKDYDTALEAFENWIQSSSHRKAIEGDFTHTAVSVKKDPGGNFYFTQLFYR